MSVLDDEQDEVAKMMQEELQEEENDQHIEVVLSDDEREEKRKGELTFNLHFVQCIMVLMNCCCSLMKDIPRFKIEAENVTVTRKALLFVTDDTASDIKRAKTEAMRKGILDKELATTVKLQRKAEKAAAMYKNKLRIARLLNETTLTGHTAISWAGTNIYFYGISTSSAVIYS